VSNELNMQTWTGAADRAGWFPGPWDGEPDKAHWKDAATGMDCLAVRNGHSGHWCGYVAVQESHPAFGKDYDDVDAEAHGGLTFADFCHETKDPGAGICHVPYPGDPDRVWWLGFDCAHAWDYSPADFMRAQTRSESHWRVRDDTTYKTLDFVKDNCRELAAQLAKDANLAEAYEVAP
jgi:hypothetical protein